MCRRSAGRYAASRARRWAGGRREADVAPLAGAVERDLLAQSRFSAWMLLFWALAGALFGLVLPGRLARIRAILFTQAAPNLLAGLAALIIAIPLIVLLALTLIGVVLPRRSPSRSGLRGSLNRRRRLVARLWAAQRAWTHRRKQRCPVLATALGTALLGALEQLAWLGLPLALLAGALGLGAVLRLMLFSRRPRLAAARTSA